LELRARALANVAAAVDRRDALDVSPGLAPKGARVHRERSTDSAGNAREERGGPQLPAYAALREQHARKPRARAHAVLVEALELARQAAGRDDGAANAAVAHEQVRPEAEPMDGRRGRQLGKNSLELVDRRGRVEQVGRPADAPRRVLAQRLVAQHLGRCELARHGAHFFAPTGELAASACGSVCAAAPMLPAPSVSTTSSASSIGASAAGSSAKSSMKIGSTAPRTRTARASDLPSAPASGVSPAE